MHVLFSLLYASAATISFREEDLIKLLEISRANNEREQITGLLLYKDGAFMQIIEGPEASIRALQSRIAADPRHHHLVTLVEGPTPRRQFPNWSMGFQNLNSPMVRINPSFSDFLNLPLTNPVFTADPSLAQRLLENFKERT